VTTTDHGVERYAEVDLSSVPHSTAEASAELIERAYKLRVMEVGWSANGCAGIPPRATRRLI